MNADQIDELISELNAVKNILTENPPDMDISEWNASPAGRVVNRLEEIMDDLLMKAEELS